MTIRKSDVTRIGLRKIAFCLLLFTCIGSASNAQELQQEEQQPQNEFRPREESTTPAQNPVTIGGGLWGNQQVQSTDANPQSNAANSDDANGNTESIGGGVVSPGRGGIRRTTSAGVTREAAGINPAGNPDVPFDDNMNLVFLIVGLAFAFMVIRKKQSVKNESLR